VPKLEFNRIKGGEVFTVLGQPITPVPLVHAQFRVLGFRIDGIAYCTDVNRIPEGSLPLLQGLKVLVLDALRHRPHPAHFGVQEALDVIAQLKPERAYLTHLSHDLDYEAVNRELPPHVRLAYDGLTFDF
jgi:phosphoribosyl 1,2-cyclic phosphate phosphodiesterase